MVCGTDTDGPGEIDWRGKQSGSPRRAESQERVSFDMERDPGERDAHVGDRTVRREVAQLHLRLVQDRAEGAAARCKAVQVVQVVQAVQVVQVVQV